jgi:hypothetical protein
VDDDIRQLALKNTDSSTIKRAGVKKGMRTCSTTAPARSRPGRPPGRGAERDPGRHLNPMPVFEYRGLTPAGKQVKGLLEADSSRPCASSSSVLECSSPTCSPSARAPPPSGERNGGRPAVAGQPRRPAGEDVPGSGQPDDVAIFTRQLSTLPTPG